MLIGFSMFTRSFVIQSINKMILGLAHSIFFSNILNWLSNFSDDSSQFFISFLLINDVSENVWVYANRVIEHFTNFVYFKLLQYTRIPKIFKLLNIMISIAIFVNMEDFINFRQRILFKIFIIVDDDKKRKVLNIMFCILI